MRVQQRLHKHNATHPCIIIPGRVAKDEAIKLGQVFGGKLGDVGLLGRGVHLGQDLIAQRFGELCIVSQMCM